MKGKKWVPNSSLGGKDSYLSEVDLISFIKEIDERSLNRNSLNTKEAFLIIQELREARYERAVYISKSCVRAFEKAKRFKDVLSDLKNQAQMYMRKCVGMIRKD